MRILLIGAPGAGKGTQATLVAERFGITHISSGDLLRKHVSEQTAIGRAAKAYLARGDLVPDAIVMDMLRKPVVAASASGGYVLDGFPRTVGQAEALERGSQLPAPDAVVHLVVPDAAVRERLAGRAADEGRADDADPDVIARRLRVYHDETEPLVAHYRDEGILVTVDGDAAPDEVTRRILAAVQAARR